MRTPEYIPIVKRQKGWVGCHQVPVVHSCFLVELGGGASRRLRYWPKPKGFAGPVDDVVHFAYSAKREGTYVSHNYPGRNLLSGMTIGGVCVCVWVGGWGGGGG